MGGAFVAQRLPAHKLRSAFGVFVLLMAAFVIRREAGMVPALVSSIVTLLVCLKLRSETRTEPVQKCYVNRFIPHACLWALIVSVKAQLSA